MKSHIEIIGSGNIGEKARQLLEKTSQLIEFGFHVPNRVFLAEDYFDGFFQRNNLGASIRDVRGGEIQDLEHKIKDGTLTREEFEILRKVNDSFPDRPLVLRSSAEGDARGTGTYKSAYTENRLPIVRKTLQNVLASYFSQDAIAFRRDANTGEGFAIIVEPMIGQKIDNWCFAPVLSGFGYTSTSRGEGYISAVPGLGGGVESKDGEKITRSSIEQFNGSLEAYILQKLEEHSDSIRYQEGVLKGSALTKTDGPLMDRIGRHDYHATAYVPSTRYRKGEVCPVGIVYEGKIGKWFHQTNLMPLFSMMDKMEQAFGKPQYFEWAMTLTPRGPAYWITQVADVDKKLDVLDFDDLGKIIFMAHTVTGTGIKECYKIAHCWNPHEIPFLYEFNQNNSNYVLLFSSRMTMGGTHARLHYSDFSNATSFLEIQDARHVSGDVVSHLGGQLDKTGKLFGVLDYNAEVGPDFDYFRSREKDEFGMKVYQGKVKVVASERQNKMVVSASD